jgi:hypothetical protein
VRIGRLAAAIGAGPRPIAVLAGAGVSRSAGIPTGQELLARAARERGQVPADDPVPWYQTATGRFPDYFAMAGAEPDGDTLPPQPYRDASPGIAHRMIARLVVAGWAGPVLTTNLDPLLERALAEAGQHVPVAFDLATMAGADLSGPVLIKLHGDYRDTSIRRTAPALHRYHPVIDALLDRVFAAFDLLVCGWSASWDLPLGEALRRAGGRRHARSCASGARLWHRCQARTRDSALWSGACWGPPVQPVSHHELGDPVGHQVPDRPALPHPVPDQRRRYVPLRHVEQRDPLGRKSRVCSVVTDPRAEYEVREVGQNLVLAPGRRVPEHISAGDEEQPVPATQHPAQLSQRLDGIRRTGPVDFQAAHREPGVGGGRGDGHRKPLLGGRHRELAMWPPGRDEHDLIEAQPMRHLARVDEVGVVDGIKGPAHNAFKTAGRALAAEAAALGLIDEYRARVCPVLAGGGAAASHASSMKWQASAVKAAVPAIRSLLA